MFSRLDRPVDPESDHILGPPAAAITLLKYGSYACPYCRAANEGISAVPLIAAIAAGLLIGKPLGLLSASAVAVRLGLASKPEAYSWRHLAGAGALAGIGFTMSLFIAGQSFADPSDLAAAKVAVFAASFLSALAGVLILARGGGGSGKLEAEADDGRHAATVNG
ncbi:MAG TPA: Na+/H+ antiporter NhaA [Thermoanaerobaculia bacterium]|nr:Na+/H+ antiporter NhaA [Thermoanaerobaculia bacterium]